MSLRRKLARLADAGPGSGAVARWRPAGPPVVAPPEPDEATAAVQEYSKRIEWLRARMEGVVSRQQARVRRTGDDNPGERPRREWDIRGLKIDSTDSGDLHSVRTEYDGEHRHGRVSVVHALDAEPNRVAALACDPSLKNVDLSRALFLDTETTGLAGGSGTIPFLIGLGWFEDGGYVVEQMLLPQLGRERPMLERLRERMAKASCLVTYNGKSFDWPLLKTRFVLNRLAVPEVLAHLDLLHVSRRVFGRRLRPVRLVTVESEVLDLRRHDDVDGAEIPSLYFDFVRGAPLCTLQPVLEHNALDLLALPAILADCDRRFGGREPVCAHDALGLAKVAMRAGDNNTAVGFALRSADEGKPTHVVIEALLLAAQLGARGKNFSAVDCHLRRALGEAGDDAKWAAQIHLALAKLCEHHLKEYERAFVHARHTVGVEGAERHARRLARLERRMASETNRAIKCKMC